MAAARVATVRGLELALHPPGDYVSDVIATSRDFYEAGILDEIRDRLERRPAGVLVDAGAMIGNHTAYLAAFVPHHHIHAFEPAPVNLGLLRRNVRPWWSTTHVHPIALSDHVGHLTMTVHRENRGHGVITETDPWQDVARHDPPFAVRAQPLDAYHLDDVTLLKIDVESHEPAVLAGARDTIARWHPMIVIEDWAAKYAALLPGYRLVAEWEKAHQTFMYEWLG